MSRLILSICMAVLLSRYVYSSTLDSTLSVNVPSSNFIAGETVFTFTVEGDPTYRIESSRGCPNDTLAIDAGTGEVSVLRTVDFTLDELVPRCVRSLSDYVIAIRTFYCLVVVESPAQSYGIPLVINILPELPTAELTFPQAFYSTDVTEGASNASLNGLSGIQAHTAPVNGLLMPDYRVVGENAGVFMVIQRRTNCVTVPVVVTARPLDREEQDYYEITLEASAGNVSTQTTIGVQVLDLNDLPPVLEDPGVPPAICENTIGTTAFVLHAVDSDSGLNGEVYFSLSLPSPLFTVHPYTGALFLHTSADFETQQSVDLEISASDRGTSSLLTQTNITVFIADLNESPPEIHIQGVSPVVVSESLPVGGVAATVQVTDGDSSSVSLTLVSVDCNCFQLSSGVTTDSGALQFDIMVSSALDFEGFPEGYRITLTACDSGTPPLTSSLELRVTLTDENEPPHFPSPEYTASVLEGAPLRSHVVQVQASDPDSGSNGQLTYHIRGSSMLFAVDEETGIVYTTAEIDRESTTPSVQLNISVRDGTGESASATVTVLIQDRNDHAPSFPRPLESMTVPESLGETDAIFDFSAADEDDSVCNGAVSYSIVLAEPEVFRVDALSGLLFPLTDSSLDYESFQSARVTVRAMGVGEGSTLDIDETTLEVTVTDVNDEHPVLDPISCPCWVPENLPGGQQCQPLSAHDLDSTSLMFQIKTGNEQGRFCIDPSTGVVNTTLSLDHEQQEVYDLQISVSDGELESNVETLTILVVDENDSPPTYSGMLNLQVPEDLEVGGFVGSVAAEHRDAGFNGLTVHSFSSPPPTVTDCFKLDPLSGNIFTKQLLQVGTVTFTIMARDLLDSSQRDSAQVTITVSGLKNNPPRFATSTERYSVPENLQPGMIVDQITATDPDSGSNGQLVYALVGESEVFALQTTGMLTLTLSLSNAAGSVYILNISASDGSFVAYQEVIITVYSSTVTVGGFPLSQNPGVGVCHLEGTVLEGISGEVTVASLPEMQGAEPITYTILEGEFDSAFRLVNSFTVRTESMSGDVFDRTQREAIFLTLRAQYQENFHLCTLTVVVMDTNDHGPEFSQAGYLVEIYQDTPVGASVFQLQATDLDEGSNAQTVYSLLTPSIPFVLDGSSGVLEVAGTLTREGYALTVQARDALDSSKTASTMVDITILPTANNPPVVTAESPPPISESTPPGTPILSVFMTDDDPGTHGRNTFCISSGNENNLFSVNSGSVVVQNALDFENPPNSFNLTVTAFDSSPNPRTQSTNVVVTLTDENDETPKFRAHAYAGSVQENQPAGTSVVRVIATDRDVGPNGNVHYSIEDTGVPFSIDLISGIITTTSTLNRESTPMYSFTVTATDQAAASEQLSSSVDVSITVLDDNDSPPSFLTPNSQTVPFFESTHPGTMLLQLTASDDDEGTNSWLKFSVESGNNDFAFSLDPWTGEVTLARSLDYDSDVRSYTLVFSVSDLGDPPLTASTTITVTFELDNVNDNFPVFSQTEYRCSIMERALTFDPPCRVTATDGDLVDSEIQYSIINGGALSINPSSGSLEVSFALDRETTPQHILLVQAEDTGSPRLSSTVIVVVTVLDSNDEVPSFESRTSVMVPEGLPPNTLLFFAHATDSDEGDNAQLSYSILGGGTLFDISAATGGVFLREPLDFEASSSHQLTVVVANPGGTSASQEYSIQVIDVDENTLPPNFPPSNPTVIAIPRTTPPAMHVAMVTAEDGDPGPDGELQYYITGGTGYGYFQIDLASGDITTSYNLTAAEGDSLCVEVVAMDGGAFPRSTSYQLLVVLEEDTNAKPFFSAPEFYASVLEGFYDGTIFTFAQAPVSDSVDPTVCYSIVSGNDDNVFAVNSSTGAVAVQSELNREVTSLYSLTLQAARPGVTSTSRALLVVEVEDINDNRPQFTETFDVSIFENFPVGPSEPFMRVFARDADLGRNGQLEYSIEDPQSLPFMVSPATGDMFLIETLNSSTSSYATTVGARDQGSPFLDTSTPVSITVISPSSPNTAQPNFSPATREIDVREDTLPGTLIDTVQAQDSDSPVLMYRIISGSEAPFIVLPNSGDVLLSGFLDRESEGAYLLLIEAWDGEHTARFSLVISVTDVNDNSPTFVEDSFSFTVTEHSLPGSTVGAVTATDGDTGSNRDVNYSIVDSELPSSIELLEMTADGTLRVVGDLDRESFPTHTLTVAVSDGGTPPLVSYARVTVSVLDSNDHVPEFTSPLPRISIPETTPPGTPVFNISTFDPDTGSNKVISYTLTPATAPFEVDGSTGELLVTSSLDAEAAPLYSLNITVSNPNAPQQTSTLSLEVAILDVLDSPPALQSPGEATISENLPPYCEVAAVAGSNNRPVYYSIVGGNERGHFFIEPLTGVVRTALPLDREDISSYSLLVQGAFAPGFERNESLTVTVLDVNDENPEFSSPMLSHTIPEDPDSTINTPLLSLTITDLDEGSNADVSSFLIPDSLASEFFSVDPSGQLTLRQPLDREQDFSLISFDIYVFDSGTPPRYSRARMTISVADSNDNIPQFSEQEYTFVLSLPVVTNTPLFTVTATDEDEGENGMVTYSLVGGNGTSNFAIGPTSGDIIVTDNYRLQPSYLLVVLAEDGGGRESQVSVFISVRECGFHNLLFLPRTITMEISEDVSVATVVFEPNLLLFDQPASLQFYFSLTDPTFAINSTTGEVVTVSTLNRESQALYQLVVQARDTASPERIAQADVEIVVTDVNDNPPQFENTPYSGFVINTAGPGEEVIRVTARDSDEGENGAVSYTLISDPSNSFAIDSDSGVITLTASLDTAALGSTIQLQVEARDGGRPPLTSQTTVSITIVDSNAPRFLQAAYNASVSEDASREAHIITVTASATSSNAAITYSIDTNDPAFPFTIDFFSGDVTVNDRGLDYEAVQFYQVLLTAIDTTTALSAQATLNISVTDVNDITPQFSSVVYQAMLRENTDIGTPVIQVSAQDLDSAPNAMVMYRFANSSLAGMFSIDEVSGSVTTAGEIDYEENPVFEFMVLAIDSGSPALTGTATVRVATENLNDNPPVFSQPSYQGSVPEDADAGTSVLFVTATDPDGDLLSYTIVNGEGSENFNVTPDGLVCVTSSLPDFHYELNVSAFDGVFAAFSLVVVEVEDQNDHPPVFNQTSYTASVVENAPQGEFVVQVFADDADRGSNAQIAYSSSLQAFSIDRDSGIITTSGSEIDREATADINLIIVARDGGGRTGTTVVEVSVQDQNDNAPEFSRQSYFDSLPEGDYSSTNAAVLTVSASDPDAEENGRVRYSIDVPDDDPNFPFLMESSTGVISAIFQIRHESTPSYNFTVQAVDMGTPEMTAVPVTVHIDILDVFNTPPVFVGTPYIVSIPEGVIPPQVLTVNTTNTASCSPLLYTIQGEEGNFPFAINDPISGVITLSQTLDRETRDFFTFEVEADCIVIDDNGMLQRLRARVDVEVHVLDVNERPYFDPGIDVVVFGSIVENSSPGSTVLDGATVLTITATDGDAGDNGTVFVRLINLGGAPFLIDRENGTVYTEGGLDREAVSTYNFQVQAFDGGSPSLTAIRMTTVIVTITDENDSPPTFNQSTYQISTPESIDPNEVVFRAGELVSDNDTAPHANIVFSLGGSGGVPFTVDSGSGEVRTVSSLDRETTSSYVLQLVASDGPHRSMAELVVNVTDVNDNPPVFNRTVYEITVPENFPAGEPFLEVFASDTDVGGNAIVEYSISTSTSPDSANISINASTGEVSFVTPPDFEVADRLELQVEATDGGGQEPATALLIIIIEDENDNHPVFLEESYTAAVRENLAAGTNVIRVEATDEDSGSNGFVEYSLSGSAANYFCINFLTGVITTRNSFDRETTSSFDLEVIATDLSDSPLSSSTTVLISVTDVNDQRPFFPRDRYSFNISELEEGGFLLLSVAAEDGDEGSNADLIYTLTGEGSSDFTKIEADGSVRILLASASDGQSLLNFETTASYELTLLAIDGGFPELTGNTTLSIMVIDENDNMPVIPPIFPQIVREDRPVGDVIVQVNATDLDTLELEFSIENQFPEFEMDSATGVISLASSLDHERRQSYSLNVVVTDFLHTTSTTVSIIVMDVNDNPPHFLDGSGNVASNFSLTVVENSEPRMLTQLNATDRDGVSLDHLITYAIEAGNEGGVFDIEASSGQLRVNVSLDRETRARYELLVTANDNGDPDLTGSATVIITVEDENDNPPVGTHQDIFIFLWECYLSVPMNLGSVLVSDPDVVNNHRFTIQPSTRRANDFFSGMCGGAASSEIFSVTPDGLIQILDPPQPENYLFNVAITDNTDFFDEIAVTSVDVHIRTLSPAIANSFSFQMQLSETDPEQFVDEHLQPLLSAITAILNSSLSNTIDLQLFSVQETQDGVNLFLSAGLPDGGFVHPTLVQHLIHSNRSEIEDSAGVIILTEHVDLCAQEVCSPGEPCSSPSTFDAGNQVFGSSSVVYVGLLEEHSISCEPRPSPCASLPCEEPSFCVEEEGVAICIDDCDRSPCGNGGSCVPQFPGYYCLCPEGYEGRNCEQTGATFTGSSYALFPAIEQRVSGTISLEVITARENGLLLYSSRFDEDTRDFVALELSDGFASLRVSYGGELSVLSVDQGGEFVISDEEWHTIVVQYNSSAVSLTVLTFDPYIKGQRTRTVEGGFHSLDLGAPLVLGSLPPQFGYNYDQTPFFPFTGCMRRVLVNGELLDFASPLEEEGTSQGCGFTDSHCSPNPCSNEGRCIGSWSSFSCACPPQHTGDTCTEPSASASFSGNGYIQYEIRDPVVSQPARRSGMPLCRTGRTSLSLALSTGGSSGTVLLLGGEGEGSEYATLEIMEGFLQFRFDLGSGEAVVRQRTVPVNDSEFHTVSVERTQQSAEMIVDGRFVARASSPGNEVTLNIRSNQLYLGAAVGPSGEPQNGFSGCILGAKLNGDDLPSGGETENFIATLTGGVEPSCPTPTMSTPSTVSAAYIFGGLGGILIFLIATSTVFIIVCQLWQRVHNRRKRSFHITTEGGGRNSPTSLTWQPALQLRSHRSKSPQFSDTGSDDFVLNNTNMNNVRNFPLPPSTPSLSETNFTEPTPPPQPHHARQHSKGRLARMFRDTSPPPRQVQVRNPAYQQDSPDVGISHTRSHSVGTERSDVTSLYQDDQEVSTYVKKRVEEANLQVEEQNLDEMLVYKEEGGFEPLGSIGSLYDIVREADASVTGTPLHSADTSKLSVEEASYLGDYGKQLDHLLDRFHNLTAGDGNHEETRLV